MQDRGLCLEVPVLCRQKDDSSHLRAAAVLPSKSSPNLLSQYLWLCLHCLQVLKLFHIHLSISLVARPVCGWVGHTEGSEDGNSETASLKADSTCSILPLAALQAVRAFTGRGSKDTCDSQAKASGAALAMSSSHCGGGSSLSQQVRLCRNQQDGHSSLSQTDELRKAPNK